jgi:anti-anti-sigma regulatory factor
MAQFMSAQGPLARSVADVRLGLDVMSQPDPRDPWWVPAPLVGPAPAAPIKVPPGVVVYEINGPLFFGASQNAMASLGAIKGDTFKVLVLHLGRVPVIDATGFVALENAIDSVVRQKKGVVLAGPLPRPRTIFDKARLGAKHPELRMADSLEAAIEIARELAEAAGTSLTPA